jgi:hypothetical protein
MDNYKTIETKLRNLESFRGNSLSANWSMGEYLVWSYNTEIANAKGGKFTPFTSWVDSSKYSVTTSRHQNLIRKAWGL